MENHNGRSWPGSDERLIVAEMIHDQRSKYWEECNMFVEHSVSAKAKNIPTDFQEDIIQEVMHKVAKHLPYFRFQSTLKTWLNLIADRCIIDTYRRLQNEERSWLSLADPLDETEDEDEEPATSEEKSAEEVFMMNDELDNGQAALLEYADAHANPVRNRLIIKMVIFEGRTYAEAAIATGCNAPVVGYIVREAQRYAREKMGHRQ